MDVNKIYEDGDIIVVEDPDSPIKNMILNNSGSFENKPLDVIDDNGVIWTAKKLKCGDGKTPYKDLPYVWCFVPKSYKESNEDKKSKKKKINWKVFIKPILLDLVALVFFILFKINYDPDNALLVIYLLIASTTYNLSFPSWTEAFRNK